jgi:lauroyl/myristoyl acyltransferase
MKRLVLQGLAAVLPWPFTYALLRWLARRHQDNPDAHAAFAHAQAYGVAHDEAAFCQRYVLYRLVDQVDLALAWFRGMRWQRRWVREEGAFPSDKGPFLVLTFHLGAGMPIPRALGARAPIAIYIHTEPPGHGFLDGLLGRWRVKACCRLTHAPTVVSMGVDNAARKMLAQLRHTPMIALVDVPNTRRRGGSRALSLPAGQIGMPTGMARLAVKSGVPVYVHFCTLAQDSPERILRMHGPLMADSEERLSTEMGRLFTDMIRRDPAAWHLWNLVDTEFAPPREESGVESKPEPEPAGN